MSITVYGQDECSYCDQTRKYYERQGIPVEYVNLSNESNAKILLRLKAEGYEALPIVRTSNQTWQGMRPDLMLQTAQEYRQEEQQRQQIQEQLLTHHTNPHQTPH